MATFLDCDRARNPSEGVAAPHDQLDASLEALKRDVQRCVPGDFDDVQVWVRLDVDARGRARNVVTSDKGIAARTALVGDLGRRCIAQVIERATLKGGPREAVEHVFFQPSSR